MNIIGETKKNKTKKQNNTIEKRKKICDCCKKEKLVDDFCKNKHRKDGINNTCKECANIRNKKYQTENKEYFIEYRKNNYEKLKEKWTLVNRSRSKEENTLNNKKQIKKGNKAKWSRKQSKTNVQFKIKQLLGIRLLSALKAKDINKQLKTQELLGCAIIFFKLYLEQLFEKEMTWENHGKIWEIDHHLPCDSFDLTDLEQQKICFHYTNLRPRFKTTEIAESFGYKGYIGNREKSNKIL